MRAKKDWRETKEWEEQKDTGGRMEEAASQRDEGLSGTQIQHPSS